VADNPDVVTRAKALVAKLQQLADEDPEAYAAYLRSPSADARQRTIDVPEAATLAEGLVRTLRPSVAADASAGATLARAAAAVARQLAEINTVD